MSAPLSTLRDGVRGAMFAKAPAKDPRMEITEAKLGVRILHLAERETGWDIALCGKARDKPLDPGAEGELCVVCADVYFRKHGYEYGRAR